MIVHVRDKVVQFPLGLCGLPGIVEDESCLLLVGLSLHQIVLVDSAGVAVNPQTQQHTGQNDDKAPDDGKQVLGLEGPRQWRYHERPLLVGCHDFFDVAETAAAHQSLAQGNLRERRQDGLLLIVTNDLQCTEEYGVGVGSIAVRRRVEQVSGGALSLVDRRAQEKIRDADDNRGQVAGPHIGLCGKIEATEGAKTTQNQKIRRTRVSFYRGEFSKGPTHSNRPKITYGCMRTTPYETASVSCTSRRRSVIAGLPWSMQNWTASCRCSEPGA